MKKLILFITALIGLASCNSYQNPHVSYVTFTNSSSITRSSSSSSSSSIIDEVSSIKDFDPEPYKTDATRIMNDVAIAVWGDNIPEDAFTEPDEDGVISSNYAIEWESDGTDSALSNALIYFQRLENFPDYLFIKGYPHSDILDNKEVRVMFIGTSNWLHLLCLYDYFVGDKIYIEFEAGPYSAWK